MNVIENGTLPHAALPGIDHVTLAGSRNGLRHLSIWKQSMAPGSATPPHRHDCEEVVLIRSGRGELHIDGRIQQFGSDTTIVVPPNVPHQIINVGNEPLELLGVLSVSPVVVTLPDGRPIDLPWAS
jgi:mannose-6-phosphate isomerase-like protein (cupin superfamily)